MLLKVRLAKLGRCLMRWDHNVIWSLASFLATSLATELTSFLKQVLTLSFHTLMNRVYCGSTCLWGHGWGNLRCEGPGGDSWSLRDLLRDDCRALSSFTYGNLACNWLGCLRPGRFLRLLWFVFLRLLLECMNTKGWGSTEVSLRHWTRFQTIWIIQSVDVLGPTWVKVDRLEGIQISCSNEGFLQRIRLTAWNVVILVEGANLTSFHLTEGPFVASVGLRPNNILCIEISDTLSRFGTSSWFVTINRSIICVKWTGLFSFSTEITKCLVPDGVCWFKGVCLPLWLPALFSYVVILDVIVSSVFWSLISFLPLSALDIKAVKSISWSKLLLNYWFAAFNIIDKHSISHEFGRLRRHILETCQFVNRVERVRRLSTCYEFNNFSLSTFDICISQIKFRFILKSNVEHAWPCALNIRVDKVEFRSIDFSFRKYAGSWT